MFQRVGVLLALIVSASSLRILPEVQEGEGSTSWEVDVAPQAGPEELGTWDQIVFDKGVWKPSCHESLQYISAVGNISHTHSQKQLLFNIDECLAYERSKSFQYKDVKISSLRTTKRRMFLHVSKSAGTFFCACGNANGENPGLPHNSGVNCHYLNEDGPWWANGKTVPGWARGKKVHVNDCSKYDEALVNKRVTLEGDENYLASEGKLCNNVENIILVREPIHRLVSHVTMMIGEERARKITLDEINADYPRLADNYLSRSLAGSSEFEAEFGTLPESTFSKVIQTLRNFDNVLIMDENLSMELQHHYGWSCKKTLGRKSTVSGGTEAMATHWKDTWPKKDWQRLLDQHKFDSKLLKEAQYISLLRSFAKHVERTH